MHAPLMHVQIYRTISYCSSVVSWCQTGSASIIVLYCIAHDYTHAKCTQCKTYTMILMLTFIIIDKLISIAVSILTCEHLPGRRVTTLPFLLLHLQTAKSLRLPPYPYPIQYTNVGRRYYMFTTWFDMCRARPPHATMPS